MPVIEQQTTDREPGVFTFDGCGKPLLSARIGEAAGGNLCRYDQRPRFCAEFLYFPHIPG